MKSILVDGGLCAQVVTAFEGYDLKQDDVFHRAGYFGCEMQHFECKIHHFEYRIHDFEYSIHDF